MLGFVAGGATVLGGGTVGVDDALDGGLGSSGAESEVDLLDGEALGVVVGVKTADGDGVRVTVRDGAPLVVGGATGMSCAVDELPEVLTATAMTAPTTAAATPVEPARVARRRRTA